MFALRKIEHFISELFDSLFLFQFPDHLFSFLLPCSPAPPSPSYLSHTQKDGGESKSSSPSSNPFLVIYGDSGTGKSAFFSRLLDKQFCRTKGGSWHNVSSRFLADHICRVQCNETLSPIQWAKSIAGQIFLALPKRHRHGTALKVGGHADQEAFTSWLEKEVSVRKVLGEWVIPVLQSLGSAGAFSISDFGRYSIYYF